MESLQRQSAGVSDEELAQMLGNGLEGRTGTPPAQPIAPGWRVPGAVPYTAHSLHPITDAD